MMWNWPKVSSFTGLDAPMKALENVLAFREKNTRSQARIQTSDATVTVLETLTIPVDTSVKVAGEVVARRTGGSAGATNDGAGYDVNFVAKNTAGTAALIAAATVTAIGESQAGWDVTVVASGGTILVKVTGAANNTIEWRWAGKSFAVKE